MSQIMSFKTLFLITLSSHLLLQTLARTCFFTSEFTVHVVTFLPKNSPPLEFHCASGDNDLGDHRLTTYGAQYKFSFCDSIRHNTLFFCTLHWGNKTKRVDVFKSSTRKKCSSGHCVWAARDDGIYFADNTPIFNKEFDWEI